MTRPVLPVTVDDIGNQRVANYTPTGCLARTGTGVSHW